jgi:uncharacterized iron-regulated membrane protein
VDHQPEDYSRRRRGEGRRRLRQPPPWTTGEKVVLVLGILLSVVAVILAVELFVL